MQVLSSSLQRFADVRLTIPQPMLAAAGTPGWGLVNSG